jgi:hypothetical protein
MEEQYIAYTKQRVDDRGREGRWREIIVGGPPFLDICKDLDSFLPDILNFM